MRIEEIIKIIFIVITELIKLQKNGCFKFPNLTTNAIAYYLLICILEIDFTCLTIVIYIIYTML